MSDTERHHTGTKFPKVLFHQVVAISFVEVGLGAADGLGLPIIGALLGHRQAVTTQRYAHLSNDPLRAATNQIGRTIATAMRSRAKGGQ